ncbi:MAG TPA: acyl-CoA dehydrogenase family protein, partial [Kofleriaceae bacterium]|nr:acyl-CoA dehydrogenase family protein [Kofleriaceae bacterium]
MLTRVFAAQRVPDASWEALREPAGTTVERAVIGGARADRVGHAFAIGYSAALEALVGEGSAALCVTEEGGAHPRAIQTRLEAGRVTGAKKWTTLADRARYLLVAACEGADADGRPRLRIVRVRADAPGVRIEPSSAAFVPEIAHARVTLDGVPGEVLAGDGYADYIKPFRTIEDIHVHAAIVGYLIGAARLHGFAHGLIERLAMVASALVALGAADAKAPATHIALAGVLATSHAIVADLEAAWAAAPGDEWTRWLRDRPLLQVASRARSERL